MCFLDDGLQVIGCQEDALHFVIMELWGLTRCVICVCGDSCNYVFLFLCFGPP
jgi:hypothetical protein